MNLDELTQQLAAQGFSPGLVFLATLIAVVFLVLVVVTRGRVLKIFRIFFRRSRFMRFSQRTGARARNYVGTSGFAPFGRLFHPLTETEKALVAADLKTPVSHEAVEEALKDYEEQEGRDPNIDRVIKIYRTQREDRWQKFKAEKLDQARRRFFAEHKAAIRRQMPGADGDITFEDVDWENLNYDRIGERIDDEFILYQHSFAEQDARLRKKGMIFKEISAAPGFIGLSEAIDIEHAKRNYLLATDYYLYDIPVDVDEDLLYEDVNDASIVSMMGVADKDIFYFLTRMRKTVNRNVLYLSILVSMFVAAFILANYWLSETIDFRRIPEIVQLMSEQNVERAQDVLEEVVAPAHDTGSAAPPVRDGFTATLTARLGSDAFMESLINKSCFALLTFLMALAITAFYYRNPYTHYQSQNRVHLINFMTSYSALLVSNFTRAESQSRGSFSGDQSGPAAKEHSKIWFMNMQWIAHRLFFVEIFLRSILFQIKRNSGYYILGIPLLMLTPVIVFLCWLPDAWVNGGAEAGTSVSEHAVNFIAWLILNIAFILLLYVLFITVCWNSFLRKCVENLLNIDDTGWKNFHNLEVQTTSAGLVRHFVGEIYNERMRVRGGGHGGMG